MMMQLVKSRKRILMAGLWCAESYDLVGPSRINFVQFS